MTLSEIGNKIGHSHINWIFTCIHVFFSGFLVQFRGACPAFWEVAISQQTALISRYRDQYTPKNGQQPIEIRLREKYWTGCHEHCRICRTAELGVTSENGSQNIKNEPL